MSELAGNDQGTSTPTDDVGSESFGDWLRRQREVREIELREIADSSKISIRYLQAFEDNRFDLLPSLVFAKGFLRQYARYVGLDPEEAVNFFLASRPLDEEPDLAPPSGRPTPTGLLSLLLLIVVAAAVVWLLAGMRSDSDRGEDRDQSPSAGEELPPATPAPQTETVAEAESPPPPVVEREASEPEGYLVTAILDFSGECWIEATIDGESSVAEIRVQGEALTLRANESIDLKLGSAGAAAITVNGVALPASPAGSVRNFVFDAEFLETLGEIAESPGTSAANPVLAEETSEQ